MQTQELSTRKIDRSKQLDDRVAVLLVGYGEVEAYNDLVHYNQRSFELLTDKFISLPSWLSRLLAKLIAIINRYEYRRHRFTSPHNQIFERQRAGIERNLQRQWGDRVGVFKAFNSCAPMVTESVLNEIESQGYNKLLIYPLVAIDSIFTSGITVGQINQAIVKHSCDFQGIRYIPSFCDRSEYLDLITRKIEEKIEKELAFAHLAPQIGIIPVLQGCPKQAGGFVTGIRESQILYDRLRDRLIERYPLMSIGWYNHETPGIQWTQPNVERAVWNLMELGATAIIMVPVGSATENRETTLDIDYLVHNLHSQKPEITFVQMSCINDNPEFLEMVAAWADPQIAALVK